MVQWTTPFMIGITNVGLNSDVFGHTTNRLTHIIPQSTFARISRFEQERNLLERFMLPLHHTRILFPLGITIMFPTLIFSLFMKIYRFSTTMSFNFPTTWMAIIIPTSTSFITDETVVI